MRCTNCEAEYTHDEFNKLAAIPKNGGRMTYGAEVHEYRVCKCGSHILFVVARRATSSHPVMAFAEAYDAKRR